MQMCQNLCIRDPGYICTVEGGTYGTGTKEHYTGVVDLGISALCCFLKPWDW